VITGAAVDAKTHAQSDARALERAQRRVRLRDLETLVAVVQAGAMRKASDSLHLSEPAISKAMRELEDALGVKLLERGRRGITPTPFGDALVRRSKALIDELQGALRELAHLADPGAGEVRLGAMESQAGGVVAAAVRAQLQRHPRMRFHVDLGQSLELIGHFLPQRLVDLVVARPLSLPLPPDVVGEALFHDQLRVAVGPEDPLARRRKVTLADLQGEHWILSRNEVVPGTPVPSAFAAAGLPFPQRVVISGSLNMRQNMLAHGRFVTCVPHSLLPFARVRGNFHILPIELPRWPSPTMILQLRGRTLGPAAEAFCETLRELSRPLRA
jgi:DNA-binding transcriptional LysR family regulator